jgi:hypothetical protein
MGGLDVVKILSYGVIGLGFLLAFLAYRLLAQEQRREQVRSEALRSIYLFMAFAVVLCLVGILGQVVPNHIASNSPAFPSPQQEAEDQQLLAIGIQNYFQGGNDLLSDPSQVIGLAKGIVSRFGKDADPFGSVNAEITKDKKNDPNWYHANMLQSALALVYALGLSPDTKDKNQAFIDMVPPSIPPKNQPGH